MNQNQSTCIGKQFQRELFQHDWRGFQDKDDTVGQPSHQVADMGHRWVGTVQDVDSQLLQGRTGHHYSLRHHR